jgi:antitoxin ParD1/3/4
MGAQMSVKASVSITAQQDKFARALVADGRYSSISAVVQRGLELLREEDEYRRAEIAALRALMAERLAGPFVSEEEAKAATAKMIERKRAQHGL